ncbi:hypothetical protein [Streptomyces sp. NBC_00893]|uniref:hypothetical protein n=1 Tax=Streptomyces sp. NBC_00893 TaxID=2975862 RepID=UPI002255F03A|nr:hypothetical protein [Streptomyces sp. NBC_00893]MCX4849806.1 hypothetical protein [Streptomyces sp. NBC_00893]
MSYRYTDPDGDRFETEADAFDDGTPALYVETSGPVRIPLDRVEELVAGIRDTAHQATRVTEQADTTDDDSHATKVQEYLSTPYTDNAPLPTTARVGRCPVMIEGGGRCEKGADHRAGRWPNDPHTPEPAPAVTEEPK